MKKAFHFLPILLIFLSGCSSEEEPDKPEENQLPKIQNEAADSEVVITLTTIEIQGAIENNNQPLLSYGVVWGREPLPTMEDNVIDESSQAQAMMIKASAAVITFTTVIEGLDPGKEYYFRVYAENEEGVVYGEEISRETESLADTKWDFYFNHFPDGNGNNWHGDVEFYDDGTAFYDEPANPGVYAKDGTWSLDGKTLTYNLQGDPEATSYILTGEIKENTMTGTYTFGDENKEWTAVKYE